MSETIPGTISEHVEATLLRMGTQYPASDIKAARAAIINFENWSNQPPSMDDAIKIIVPAGWPILDLWRHRHHFLVNAGKLYEVCVMAPSLGKPQTEAFTADEVATMESYTLWSCAQATREHQLAHWKLYYGTVAEHGNDYLGVLKVPEMQPIKTCWRTVIQETNRGLLVLQGERVYPTDWPSGVLEPDDLPERVQQYLCMKGLPSDNYIYSPQHTLLIHLVGIPGTTFQSLVTAIGALTVEIMERRTTDFEVAQATKKAALVQLRLTSQALSDELSSREATAR